MNFISFKIKVFMINKKSFVCSFKEIKKALTLFSVFSNLRLIIMRIQPIPFKINETIQYSTSELNTISKIITPMGYVLEILKIYGGGILAIEIQVTWGAQHPPTRLTYLYSTFKWLSFSVDSIACVIN